MLWQDSRHGCSLFHLFPLVPSPTPPWYHQPYSILSLSFPRNNFHYSILSSLSFSSPNEGVPNQWNTTVSPTACSWRPNITFKNRCPIFLLVIVIGNAYQKQNVFATRICSWALLHFAKWFAGLMIKLFLAHTQYNTLHIDNKHRKNRECCLGHYLIVNHYSSMSWFKFRNLSEMVNCVTNSLLI